MRRLRVFLVAVAVVWGCSASESREVARALATWRAVDTCRDVLLDAGSSGSSASSGNSARDAGVRDGD